MVRSQVQQIPWTEPLVRFGVQAILDYREPVQTRPNLLNLSFIDNEALTC